MAAILSKQAISTQSKSLNIDQGSLFAKIAEGIWFLVSFILFVILGPFSAPIAMIALLQLGCEENDQPSPEPMS
jgi:hypothetical protein